jgi:hypothetical protein
MNEVHNPEKDLNSWAMNQAIINQAWEIAETSKALSKVDQKQKPDKVSSQTISEVNSLDCKLINAH